jgi:non-homologous end joining protein Ku
MSDTVSRKSGSTTLTIGSVQTPVAIYKIIGDTAKARKWELANAEGEPWQPPVAGTATGSLPQTGSGGLGEGPLGEAPAPPEPAAEIEPEEKDDSRPDPVWKKDDTVYLADGRAAVVMSATYFNPEDHPGDYWQYALSEDGTAAKAIEGNPWPETQLFARSPMPRKGIRKDDGTFVDLTDAIAEITERSTLEEMRVVSFIDTRHVPRERIISAYYLAGDANGEGVPPTRLLATLMRAMRAKQRVAVVRFSKRVGQTLGVLTARRDGSMLLLELAYAAQERKPNPTCLAANQVEPREGDVAGAIELIEAMAGKRESLDSIRDPRLTMEEELVARAEAGELDDLELGTGLIEDDEVGQLGELLRTAAVA